MAFSLLSLSGSPCNNLTLQFAGSPPSRLVRGLNLVAGVYALAIFFLLTEHSGAAGKEKKKETIEALFFPSQPHPSSIPAGCPRSLHQEPGYASASSSSSGERSYRAASVAGSIFAQHLSTYFFISCLQSVCSLQVIFNPGTLGKKNPSSSDARYTRLQWLTGSSLLRCPIIMIPKKNIPHVECSPSNPTTSKQNPCRCLLLLLHLL
jgi:hypothetical protein